MTMRHSEHRRDARALIALIVIVALVMCFGGVLLSVLSPVVEAQRVQFRDPVVCDQSVAVNMAGIATTQMVALTAGQRVQVCGFALSGGGATTAKFVRGTGSNCGTGTADVTAPFEFGDNTSIPYGGGVGTIFRLPAGEALCVTNSAAVQLSGVITFTKF